MTAGKNEITTKPPTNTRWIMRRADLPQHRAPIQVEVTPEGNDPFVITVDKRQRQVVEALDKSPLYCASPVRLSDVVHIVKREHRLNIETLFFSETAGNEKSTFGIYVLRDKLRFIPMSEVAA